MLNCRASIFLFLSILFLKFATFLLIINFTSIGGGDSDYYNKVALGEIDYFVNNWSYFLSYMNEIGLYNRYGLKYVLFLLSSLVIPFLVFINLESAKSYNSSSLKWNFILIVSLYPVLFLFSLDIYRDIVMVLLFILAVTFIHISIDSKQILFKVLFLFLFLLLSYYLISWRPYLGSALILAIFIYPIAKIHFFTYKVNIILYFIFLSLFFMLGLLDPILLYRGIDGFENGNNSIGIGLYERNVFEFIVLYVYSSVLQLFSLHFINLGAIFLFLLESVPFTFAVYFIIKNRSYLTNFHKFLLLFFVIYGTVWLLGNDNLGTAMRLRIYNYLVVLIITGSIYIIKKDKKRLSKNEK